MKYLDDLMYWVGERERIRHKKEAGEKRPWTADPILDTYRFCNVERERDKVTVWIHQNWLRPNSHSPNLAFAMAVARMVNLPETLDRIGFPHAWLPVTFIDTIEHIKKEGKKAWTSAYMITGGYSEGGETKEVIIARVLSTLHSKLKHDPVREGDTLEVAANKLRSPGIGTFLSAQIVADLKFSPLLERAKDWNYWCAPGPGSTMGLNFLHDRPPTTTLSEKQFMKEVNEVKALLAHAGVHLCAQNTQNCLCEFSKYVRAKHLGKRLKSTYVPA